MRHWLLSLRIGGAVTRLTTAPQEITATSSVDGTTYAFQPGLNDPAPTEAATSADGAEYPVTALLPQATWEALCDATSLGSASAELALWEEDTAWEARVVWADGRVDSPVYETEADPVSFSVIETPWEDQSLIPALTEVISGDTWPVQAGRSLPEAAIGSYYPYIFGAPGVIYASDTLTEFFGWPAILVEIDTVTRDNFSGGAVSATVLIAAHPMVATSARLYNRTTGLSATISIVSLTDGLGQSVRVMQVAGATLQITEGDELWASCSSISAGGLATGSGTVARGVGEVAEWLLRHSTVRLDLTRLPQLQRLNAFKVDFFINQPSSAWAILNDTVLGFADFPAFWRRSSAGYYLAARPWEPAVLEAPPPLTINPALAGDREGPVTVSSSADLATDLVFRYGRDEALGAFQRVLTCSPHPIAGALANPYAASAYAQTQQRRLRSIEAPGIQDPATAWLLLSLLARTLSGTRRTAQYRVPADPRLEVGALVAVTDAEIRWTTRRCWVVAVSLEAEDGWVTVQVEELIDRLRSSQGGA